MWPQHISKTVKVQRHSADSFHPTVSSAPRTEPQPGVHRFRFAWPALPQMRPANHNVLNLQLLVFHTSTSSLPILQGRRFSRKDADVSWTAMQRRVEQISFHLGTIMSATILAQISICPTLRGRRCSSSTKSSLLDCEYGATTSAWKRFASCVGFSPNWLGMFFHRTHLAHGTSLRTAIVEGVGSLRHNCGARVWWGEGREQLSKFKQIDRKTSAQRFWGNFCFRASDDRGPPRSTSHSQCTGVSTSMCICAFGERTNFVKCRGFIQGWARRRDCKRLVGGSWSGGNW